MTTKETMNWTSADRDAEEAFLRGEGGVDNGECNNKAVKYAIGFTLYDTDSADQHFERGMNYAAVEQFDDAICAYGKAIKIGGHNLGVIYLFRGDANAALERFGDAAGDYAEAYRLLCECSPDIATGNTVNDLKSLALARRGWARSNTGHLDEAISDYTEAIRLNRDNEAAFCGRADILCAISEYGHAISDYDEAIRLDPSYAAAYNGRGVACHYMMEYDSAVNDYSEALLVTPCDDAVYTNRGETYRLLGQYENAVEDFKTALLLEPGNAGAGMALLEMLGAA